MGPFHCFGPSDTRSQVALGNIVGVQRRYCSEFKPTWVARNLLMPTKCQRPKSSPSNPTSAMASEGSSSSVDPNDVYTKFTASELFWKDRQQFLQSRGYMLRPRYRPGWIPSWKMNPTMKILHAEDRLSFRVSHTCYIHGLLLILFHLL